MSAAPAEQGKLYGALAEFDSAAAVYHACEGVRDAGRVETVKHGHSTHEDTSGRHGSPRKSLDAPACAVSFASPSS